jgi:hypothetical protein
MGTDIHLYVEEYRDGEWREVLGPYVRKDSPDRRTWDPYWQYDRFDHGHPDPWARQYNLFAFLADVRNGTGFAGVSTGKPVTPQFPHRGIPEDTSYCEPEYDEDGYRISGHEWLGDHSFTYAYLDELLNAPWDMEFHSQGTVNLTEYQVFKDKGIPNSWSGGVYGGSTAHWSNEEFEKRIEDKVITQHDYTTVHWKWKPLWKCNFHRWVTETLKPMFEDPSQVRVLMGFDS